jgi:hypothetical protein
MYSLLVQYNETAKHKVNVERNKTRAFRCQQFLQPNVPTTTKGPDPDQFSMELCEAFLAADIPFWKLTNNKLKDFLERNCNKIIPDESTIRKNYMEKCFKKVNFFKYKKHKII